MSIYNQLKSILYSRSYPSIGSNTNIHVTGIVGNLSFDSTGIVVGWDAGGDTGYAASAKNTTTECC
jgi:hypothetical protein